MRRLSLFVAISVLAVGCTPQLASRPMPKRTGPISKAVSKPIAYTSEASKVKVMTQAFSASQNEGLNQATTSLSKLTQALSSAFRFGAAAPGTPEAVVRALRVAGMRAAYQVTGVHEHGGATFTYDDATRELTGVRSAEAEVKFAFDDQGATRSLEATILRSPDGTTGSFRMTVTGTWNAFPPLMDAFGPPRPAPEAILDENGDPVELSTPVPPSPVPFKFLNNEIPATIDSVAFELAIAPRGEAAEAVSISGTLDEPGAMPGSSATLPLHWKLRASVPSVSLDWESRARLDKGASHIEGRGELLVAVENGEERFVYDFEANEATRSGSLNLTNVGAKLRLAVRATQAHPSRPPEYVSELVSTEDGSVVGTVALDPKRPRFAVVTLADGSRVDWELYPADMALPGLSPPAGAPGGSAG